MVVICTYTDRPSTSCRIMNRRASQFVSRLIDRRVSSGKEPGIQSGKPSVRIRKSAISRAIVSGASRRTSDPEGRCSVAAEAPQSAQTHNDSAGPSYSPRSTITTDWCSPMALRARGYGAFLVIPPPPCWRTANCRRQGHRAGGTSLSRRVRGRSRGRAGRSGSLRWRVGCS